MKPGEPTLFDWRNYARKVKLALGRRLTDAELETAYKYFSGGYVPTYAAEILGKPDGAEQDPSTTNYGHW